MISYSGDPRKKKAGSTRQCLVRFVFYIFIFCIIMWSVSCRKQAPTAEDVNVPEPNVTSEAPAVAATVNGIDIAESDVDALVEPEFEKLAAKAAQMPPAFAEQRKKELRRQALERLIVAKLLDAEVEKAQIDVSEQEVNDSLGAMATAQNPPLSIEQMKAAIEASGQDFGEVRRQVRRNLCYMKLFQAQYEGKINVTEDDAEKYYSEHPKEFVTQEQVRASHILIKPDLSDPNSDPNQADAAAKAKAEELLKQIRDGADFAELAKKHSECPSAVNGGDLNYFGRGQMVAPFEKAAFELEPGQISDIVKTRFGYHIIKVTDHKDSETISFEQAKDSILRKLTQDKQREIAGAYIQSLKYKAEISYPLQKRMRPEDLLAPQNVEEQ